MYGLDLLLLNVSAIYWDTMKQSETSEMNTLSNVPFSSIAEIGSCLIFKYSKRILSIIFCVCLHCLCCLMSGDKLCVKANSQGSSLPLHFHKPQTTQLLKTSPASNNSVSGSRTPVCRAVSPAVNAGAGRPVHRRISASRQPRVLSPRHGKLRT